jgi:cytochrome c oxidase cbb3-type subunit 3
MSEDQNPSGDGQGQTRKQHIRSAESGIRNPYQNPDGGVTTTGHIWDDDLADFTNQPPRWWMLALTASAIWIVVYWLYYPSVPIPSSNTFFKGVGGWTAIKEMEADKDEVDAVRGKYEAKIKNLAPAAILADNDLTEYVKRSGKVLFGDNCAPCHGTNGVGTRDKEGLFAPVLGDDDWLYGGKIDDIYATISGGRQGMMVAHKDSLSAQQIDDVAQYVKAMSDEGKDKADADSAVGAGKKVFMESDCTACHGTDAKGIQAMGSANLTDKIWRFEGSLEGIERTIAYGVNSGDPKARVAIMPSFTAAGKLSDADIKKLAVYVYKFGGGQPDAPVAPALAPPAVTAAPAVKTK